MELRHLMMVTLYIFVQLLGYCTEASDSERPLRLLGLLPSSGADGWTGGQACLAPSQMAVADINANPDVLAGYQLRYSWIDTQCNPGVAVYRMFQEMTNRGPYIMLMGDGCSIVSEATSQVSYLFNISQVSYGASSPILSDRKRFPQFFRVTGPDNMLSPARIALMRLFNWKKVATINQAREFFSVVIDDFVNRVKSTDIMIVSQEIFGNSDPITRVENLKKHDARIIITAMYEDRARKVLCAAYKIGLYGPKIVWVFVGWFNSEFWRTSLDEVDCTAAQMDAVAERSLVTAFFSRNPQDKRGVANMTAAEFDERLVQHPSFRHDLRKYDFVTARCYDHIWVAALAMDCADKKLKAMGYNKSLHEFTYADWEINEAVFGCMSNVSFTGVSGNIDYGLGADPIKNVKLEQIQGGVRTLVGQYRMDVEPNQFEWFGEGIQWKDGHVPRDSTYVIRKEITIPVSVYIPMATCSSLGIALAVAFLIFNVFYRKNPTVKLSSPNINNVLLCGCVLCYTTVFMKPTETSNTVTCKARIFSFSLGFTIAFGALFSKTWRVYRIFTNKKLLRMTIKDYQLLAIICGLVVVVLSVLVAWEIVSPQVIVVQALEKEVYVMGNDAEVRPFVRICHSKYSSYFSWVLYIIEGALLSFGAFLAWETRHVKIEALNDSHQIGLCLYNVVVLSAVGLTLSLLLEQQIIILYGMTSGCLIIGTTVVQVVVFVPKVLAVFQKAAVGDVTTVGSRRDDSQISGTGTVRTTALATQSTTQKGP